MKNTVRTVRNTVTGCLVACLTNLAMVETSYADEAAFSLPELESDPASSQPGIALARIRQVALSGNKAISRAELQAVAQPFLDRPLNSADLESLRQALTRHYIERGFINSGVRLAADPVRGETLHLEVIEGAVATVKVEGLHHLSEAHLVRQLVSEGEPLNLNVLQDRVRQLLDDPMIERLNVQVLPGERPGLAILDAQVKEARPYRLSVFANNHQAPAVGEFAGGLQGELYSLTGSGDRLSLTLQGNDAVHGYSFAWQVPVGQASFHAQINQSDSAIVEEPIDRLDIDSESTGWEIGFAYPLINTFRQRFSLGLDFSHRDSRTRLLGLPFAFSPGAPDGHNTVDDWRFYQEYLQRDSRLAYALRSSFTVGSNNVPALAGATNMPSDSYWLWVGQGHLVYPISQTAQLLGKATLQYTDDRLVALEQLSVGGANTLRGYRENQLVRDRGWMLSLEYRYQMKTRPWNRYRLTIYPLFDIGSASNVGQTQDHLASLGLGVNLASQALEADLVLAKQLKEPAVESHDTLQDAGVHLQIRYRF